ncbi:MAG: adenosylcobinamide-GDP ribazoletransferase [Gammaproteobacteria bacterium]|nr:adenosylcobinamide-GDP ribazoletransferase [Gammaproteobacteria bacterium]
MRSFLIALQFLTVLPIRIKQQPDAEATGRSLLYYPLVGLMLGAFLAVPAWMLGDAAALVAAALLLSLWVAATGALHLDGLADSADAWIGGFGDRDRTLAIMKDPYCGPAAVTTLVLVLLIKFTALTQIIANGNWAILLVVPVLGRSTLILLFLTTPYVRAHGLGSLLADHLPRHACIAAVFFTVVTVLLISGVAGFWLLLTTAGILFILRWLMQQRLGGTTGDTAGALVEITEAAVLVTAALVW